MLNQPGKPPVPMTMQQIADLLSKQGEMLSKQAEMLSKQAEMLSKQGEQIQIYERRIAELETSNQRLQKVLLEKNCNKELLKPDSNPDSACKTEPLFKLDILP
jgi:predicted RNase H-like nuclease (RuvC/YqgF family)